ncbi:MAG: homocysteine S-methyltransferase [Dermatophilaceae bacterium]
MSRRQPGPASHHAFPVGRLPHPVVLDGGMSNALQERGHALPDVLWTARVLWQRPDEVAAAHRAYYQAGARVATTASYQASVPGLVAAGLEPSEAEATLTRSVRVARDVRDELSADGVARWVAASVGPYGAVLADGSEYRGRYGLSRAQLREFHLPRLELLAAAEPDLLAVETIPDLLEAEVLAQLLADVGMPAWFSFSLHEGHTGAGQPLAEAFSVAASPTCVVAVGVNCCPATEVLPALGLVAEATDKPAVVYPNGAGEWDAAQRRWRGGNGWDIGLAREWVAAGAALVGGCCQVGPDLIAELATELTPLTDEGLA